MRKKLILAVLLLCAAVAVYGLLTRNLQNITQAPPEHVTGSAPMEAALSHITLPVYLPLSSLQDYANSRIPEVLIDEREKRRFKSRVLGIPVSVDGKLFTKVKRRAPVQVRGDHGQLELIIPLAFNARFEGKDNLDPDARTKGSVNIRLRFMLGMTPEWQPTLEAKATYHWVRKPKLRVGPVTIDVSKRLGSVLRKRLRKLTTDLEENLRDSAKLREQAAARWHELHQVRPLGGSDTPAWLVVDPQAAYFSPVRITAEAVELEFALAARLTTLIGSVQPPPVAEPLPPLNIGPPPSLDFLLQLPVSMDYAGMRKAIHKRYANRTLDVPPGTITPLDFKLYTSGDSLVLGTQVKTTAPGRLLNSKGWLYLQGRPTYVEAEQQLKMADFGFTREVDNWLLSGASWMLQESLREYLANALSYDLSERIKKAELSMHERINRPVGDGFVMSGTLHELRLNHIQPRANDLLLLLDARGQLALSTQLTAPGENTANLPETQPGESP